MRGSRITGMVLGTSMVVMGLLFVTWAIEGPGSRGYEYLLTALASGAGISFVALRGPLGRSIGRMIEGEESDEQLELRVEELEARLAGMEQRALTSGEVEAQFVRLSEVEERLEFAERVLTRIEPAVSEQKP